MVTAPWLSSVELLLKSGVPIRMSLKPSSLKSPAELTANPVSLPPAGPVKMAPGTVVPVVPTLLKIDVTDAVGRRGEAGQARAAVDEIGGAGARGSLGSTDQQVVDVLAPGRHAVDVAAVGHREAGLIARVHAREDQALVVPLCPRVETLIVLSPSPRGAPSTSRRPRRCSWGPGVGVFGATVAREHRG